MTTTEDMNEQAGTEEQMYMRKGQMQNEWESPFVQ